NQRSNRFVIRKQGLSVQMWKDLICGAEGIRPDEPAVLPDAPAVGYVSTDHLLSVSDATQHKPFTRKQLRSGREVNFCLPAKARPIEIDCFLRKPCKFCRPGRPQLG